MSSVKTETKKFQNNHPKLNTQDIKPSDDAFHGSPKRVAAEWWYFDAIFDNNYSTHIGFMTFSRKKIGIVSPKLEFYKSGELVNNNSRRYSFKNFETSKQVPFVKLFNNPLIEFDKDKYKSNGEWIYRVKTKIEDNAANLIFTGITQGWKIETDFESWTVAQPMASVEGEIIVNGKRMKVDGIGYHDHNWNYSLLTLMNYGIGWYWGKIRSKSFNLTWANIIKSSKRSEILAILNEDRNGYFNIDPKDIHLTIEEFTRIRGRKTPTIFTLQIEEKIKKNPIKIDIKMESESIHFGKSRFAPYWRYHINTTGSISLGNKKEQVNKTQIMEYLSFS